MHENVRTRLNLAPSRSELESRLLRLLIAAGVLSASIVLGALGTPRILLVLVALVVAVPLVWVLMRWPLVGLLAVPIVNLGVRFSIPTGTGTFLPLSTLIIPLLTGVLILSALTRRYSLQPISKPSLLLLGLAGLSGLSFVAGQFARFPYTDPAPITAQLGGIGVFVITALSFFVAAQVVRNRAHLALLVWTTLSLMVPFVVGRLVPPVGQILRLILPGAANGSVLWTWVMAIAASQALLNSKIRKELRFVLILLAASIFYVNFIGARSWASGWIPAMVALIVIIAIGLPRLGWPAMMGGVIFSALNWGSISDVILFGDNAYSLATRLEAWEIVLQITQKSPILGLGPANYYWYTPLFPIRGFFINFNSHNNYVDLLAQTGIVGLLLFLWFAWEMVKLLMKTRERLPRQGFERAYIVGALGGLAGMLVAGMLGDWFLPFVYNIGIDGMRASLIGWMFLGAAVSVSVYRSENPEPGSVVQESSQRRGP